MKKKSKPGLFDSKRAVLIAAVLLAVLSWITVAGFINPVDERIIPNVKIDYSKRDSDYLNKNLQIVSDQKNYSFADVKVSGDSSLISGFSNTDVVVYPDYSAVNGPGEHVIPLKAEKITPGNYNIVEWSLKNSEHSLRSNPTTTITITFEEVDSKTLPVTVRADKITAAEGFFRDPPVPSQKEITITGPKSEVSRVTQVVANITQEQERNETVIFSGVPLELYDHNNNLIDSNSIQLSPVNNVEVDIPILEIQPLNLRVDLTGVPQGFDTEWLQGLLHLSTDSISVVGTTAAFDNMPNEHVVKVIDISQLGIGWESESVPLNLPDGIQNMGGLRQVNVSFDSSGLVEKTFVVTNQTVINSPRNVEITPVSSYVNVTLVGPEDQIEALLPENIMVEIDAFQITAARGGQQTIPGRVVIPTANRVFATGSYPIVCDVVVA